MTLQDIYTDIENLANLPNTQVTTIGSSVLGNPLYAVHIGCYNCPQLIVEAAHHAREYVTTLLLIEMVKFLHNKVTDFGIYFVPLVNPDGVQLVLEGVNSFPPDKQAFLLEVNNQNPNFSLWKANANAVDLNVNYDALWGGGSQNVFVPSSGNFVGYQPNSEPEVQALIDFTKQVNPVLTLSYHTKGEVIYYGFEVLSEQELARDEFIANRIAGVTGYLPIVTQNSTGGYSDWVSLHLRVPAFTIEVGNESLLHPIGYTQLPEIYEQNKTVPLVAYDALVAYNATN